MADITNANGAFEIINIIPGNYMVQVSAIGYATIKYFDLANNIRQNPYDLLNTRFGIGGKNFEVMFWGRNLSDEKYISYAYYFGAIHLGNPKTYGFTLVGKF